jgi:hypothetical protein
MAEILTFIIGVKVYINNNTHEKEERRFKEVFKQTDKIMEPYFKDLNKKIILIVLLMRSQNYPIMKQHN